MSHNVIDGAAGQLAALHTALSGNDFTIAALGLPAAPTVVLDVVADTAIFTGNHGATVALATGAQPVIIEQTTRLMSENVNLELRFQ